MPQDVQLNDYKPHGIIRSKTFRKNFQYLIFFIEKKRTIDALIIDGDTEF